MKRLNNILPVLLAFGCWLLFGCSSETAGPNRAPVAHAGPDRAVNFGDLAVLDGSGSYDPDGDGISFRWELVAVPDGGTAGLSSVVGETVELVPDALGVWVIRLVVSDGSLDSEPDVMLVRAGGEPCEDASWCDDGLYCTGEERCVDGWCRPGTLDCSFVADACNQAGCDEDADQCAGVPKADGTQCDDGFWCTVNDACAAGACTGDARDCSQAAAECVAGVCNEAAQRCEGQPIADGDLCDDGQFCTVNERCNGGSCQGGEARDCSSAGGGCVDGMCDEGQDACVGDPLAQGTPCNDDQFCTVGDACDGLGNCVGTARDCSALTNQCNQGVCDEDADQCTANPINESNACDDGLYCAEGETCQSGSCTGGTQLSCHDGDPCTDDSCNEAGDACLNQLVPRPGDEGPYGNANCGDTIDNDCDRQVDGADPDCQQCQNDGHCNDGNLCTVNTCESDHTCLTSFVTNGTACDDGQYCTNPDQCMDGVCDGDALDCSGLDDQCNQGVCDEGNDECAANPINQGQACNDGVYCNVNETCQSGSCTGGEARDCSGEVDDCNDGICNEGLGQCQKQPANNGQPCNDGQFCTNPDTCSGGLCSGPPRDCSGAGDQCNDGICDENVNACIPDPKQSGEPCNDGQFCTQTDTCDGSGGCQGAGNPCTTECWTVCDEAADECDPTLSGTSCTNDGEYCTGTEECDGAGNCSGLGNPCPQTECNNCNETNNNCFDSVGTPCSDDNVFCNGPEVCDGNGNCGGSGNPCLQTECNICQEDIDSCFDPPTTPCTDDNLFCNGSEMCDGSGTCDHTGDPCAGMNCNEGTDTCMGCSQDDECPAANDLCRPACSLGAFGCVTPPTAMVLTCEDPVDLGSGDTSGCTVVLMGGDNTGQDACINCTTEVGLVTLDIADFGDDTGGCDLDGWRFSPGEPATNCLDSVDKCSVGGGPKDCCDDLNVLCTQLDGDYVLKTDKDTNCGNKKEEWRLNKSFDFSDLADIEICFFVGDNNADDKQGVLVYAADGVNGPDRIFCQVDKVQPEVDDVLYPFCASLPAWADDNSSVTIMFVVHSENGGRIMYLDDISVHGRYEGCSVSSSTVFFEDFSGCTDPIGDGWNGWTVDSGDTGAYPKCPGFQCSSLGPGNNGAEVDDDWMTLERSVDASTLDGNVKLCFNYGDDGEDGGSQFDVTFNAGNGWGTAWSQAGNPGPDQDCREVCINLSNIDSDANRNPSLDIRFSVDASGGKIDIYEIWVEGAQYCDGETIGATQLDTVSDAGGGTYTFNVRDVPTDQFTADILCSWDSPPPGEELEARASVRYQP